MADHENEELVFGADSSKRLDKKSLVYIKWASHGDNAQRPYAVYDPKAVPQKTATPEHIRFLEEVNAKREPIAHIAEETLGRLVNREMEGQMGIGCGMNCKQLHCVLSKQNAPVSKIRTLPHPLKGDVDEFGDSQCVACALSMKALRM